MTAANPASVGDARQPTRRRMLVCALLFFSFGILTSGCSDNSTTTEQMNAMNTDINELKRLIQLPGDVKGCEWQTGKVASHGGDWWVAAVLEVASEDAAKFLSGPGTKELFETPLGMTLTSTFAALNSFPEAQPTQSKQISLVTETYGVEPYAKSPLLNGKAIRLSDQQVLVVLWTI